MHDLSRVQVQQPAQKLVHKVPEVLVCQLLLAVNQPIQISFHLFSHDVHVLVVSDVRRLLDVNQLDDVFVVEEF